MTLILGMLLGMLYIGFRYYRDKYKKVKIKYDKAEGDNVIQLKETLTSLSKRYDELKKRMNLLN